ncbi:MAG: glycosyltransferase [Candidatus Micrarchaeaceae archaeon]
MLINDALRFSGINTYSKWLLKSGLHNEMYNFSYSTFAKQHYYVNMLKYFFSLKDIIKNSSESVVHYTSIMPVVKTILSDLNKNIMQFMTVHDLFFIKYYFPKQTIFDHTTIIVLYYNFITKAKIKGVHFITGSEYIKKQLKKYFNIKADVVYEFIDNIISDYKYENVLNRKENKIYVLNVSDCNTRKNIEFRNHIERLFNNYVFVNVGCELNNNNVINFKNIDDNMYYSIFHDIDYVFLPSFDEGFGIPFYEAMYFHKPVLAFNLPTYVELYPELKYAKNNDDMIYMFKNINKYNDNYIDIFKKGYVHEKEYEKLRKIYGGEQNVKNIC